MLEAPGAAEAHLHILRLDQFEGTAEAGLLDRFGRLLTTEERQRQARPTVENRRREVLLTRALVRSVLSGYTGADPLSWRFGAQARGRPFCAELPFDFNLSHTEGMIVCLVAGSAMPGVDVEFMPRRGRLDEVATHFFAPLECAALSAVPEAEKRRRFFTYWTLKEAYIKAKGDGLALPLDAFWFDLAGDKPEIAFDGRIADDAAAWRFESLALSDDHLCGIALKIPHPPTLRLIEAQIAR
jgi:4'-phosphopantetheinyl transferase